MCPLTERAQVRPIRRVTETTKARPKNAGLLEGRVLFQIRSVKICDNGSGLNYYGGSEGNYSFETPYCSDLNQ